MVKRSQLRTLLDVDDTALVDALSTNAQTLFGLLVLIVDIQYRNRYGEKFEDGHDRAYSERVQFNEVLADQKSPVENGLLGM